MEDMNVGYVKILNDYYDKILGMWVKEFMFKLTSEDMGYYVRIKSLDNKYKYLDYVAGDDIDFSDHKLLRKLYLDFCFFLKTGEQEKCNSIYEILDRLGDVRENIDYLIPLLLKMTEDNDEANSC